MKSRKTTVIIVLSLIGLLLLFNEMTGTKDSNSFYQLQITSEASIEHTYEEMLNQADHFNSLAFPTSISEQQATDWITSQKRTREKELHSRKEVPSLFIRLNDSLQTVSETGSYHELDFEFQVPLFQLLPEQHIPNSIVTFQAEGVWLTDINGEKALHLHGSIPDTLVNEPVKLLFPDKEVNFASNFSPLSIVLSSDLDTPEFQRQHNFKNTYLVKENESIHFLLETLHFPLKDEYLSVMLPAGSNSYLSFRSDFGSLDLSDAISVPLDQTLGEEYLHSGRALTMSPRHQLSLDRIIQYDQFILFEATPQQSIEHEILISARFIWSDGKEQYLANSLYPLDPAKLMFITEGVHLLDSVEDLTIHSFDAHLMYDFEIKLPIAQIEEGHLASFLGWSFHTDGIESSTSTAPPKIILRSEKREFVALTSSFTIHHSHTDFFRLEGKSTYEEGLRIVYSGGYDYRNTPEKRYTLDFTYSHAEKDGKRINNFAEANIDFTEYEFHLVLPEFYTEISSEEIDYSLNLNKSGRYFEPR
ncbi:hypothetical protein [Bacillus horti]|uniref:Regulatory protein YycH domain-containing protein n=1 Tax=Caldalkalibacillus horti TaxID=77523 RepID=A0ABT9W5M3_9BACI|nr:hypothetical protein [Bacillus horti]MDQ0168135.1 hypothetical protein [Bacillus horti]